MAIEKDKWKNRRRMTWLAVLSGLLFPLLILYSDSDQLGQIAIPFYMFVSSIAGAYIGFATVDDKWTLETNSMNNGMGPNSGLHNGPHTDTNSDQYMNNRPEMPR